MVSGKARPFTFAFCIFLAIGLWKALTTPIDLDRPVNPAAAQVVLTDMLSRRVSDSGDDIYCVGAPKSSVDLTTLRRRFRAKIFPINSCRMDARGAVILTQSGEKAEWVQVDKSACTILGNRCEVDASAVYGSLGGDGFLYTLQRDAGEWMILDVSDTWIA